MKAKSLIFGFIGCLLLSGAVVTAISVLNFRGHASHAVGSVVTESAGPAHVMVKFTTAKGEEVEFNQGGFVSLSAGESVPVLYDPAKPREYATVDSFGAQWFVTMILGFLGVMFVLAPVMRTRGLSK